MRLQSRLVLSMLLFIILLSGISVTPASPLVTKFGGTGTENGLFEGPRGVEVINDQIYVSDFSNARIQIFDLDGNYINQFGDAGSANGQLNSPEALTFYDSSIYVTEFGNNRVQVLDLTGSYITKFGSTELSQPFESKISGDYVYVSDRGNGRIALFNATDYNFVTSIGEFTSGYSGLEGPVGIATDDTLLYVADRFNNTIKMYRQQGHQLAGYFGDGSNDALSDIQLTNPSDIEIIDDILVVSSFEGIHFFDRQGQLQDSYLHHINTPWFFDITDTNLYISEDFTNEVNILKLVSDPTDLELKQGQNSITVTWKQDNSNGILEAKQYRVYRNSKLLVETSDKYFTDFSVETGETYTYSIQALGIIGESEMVSSSSSIKFSDKENVTVTETTTVSDIITTTVDRSDLSLSWGILPLFSTLVFYSLIRIGKKYR